MRPTSFLIQAVGAAVRLGDRQAVAGVDLEVSRGEAVALVGSNGAGKSTLLHLFAGVLRPDEGAVLIDGRDPQKPSTRKVIGFAPQALAVYPELTVLENARFFARVQGVARREVDARAQAVVELAGLRERSGDRTRSLSGGMQRRLHVACASVHDPRVLLLDEPAAGVDIEAREQLLDTIVAHAAQGRAVLWATHELEDAARIADRVVVMREGRIVSIEDRKPRRGGGADAHGQLPKLVTPTFGQARRARLA